jgi:hypothetical protein
MNAFNPADGEPFTPEGPQPLVREPTSGEAYPVHALGPLRAVVEAVQGATQAPIALPAASALAAASLAVQAHADVEALGGGCPASLYFLTVAASGERKSACDKPVLRGLRTFEAEKGEEHMAAMKAWKRDAEAYDAKRKAVLRAVGSDKADKATAARADLEALGDEPDPPLLSDRTCSEPTLEGIFRSFLHGQPSLALFSDEAGQFLGGFAMSADHRVKTLAGLNKLWDGAEIQRTRAGEGVFTLRGRRMALHLMAQPVVMRDFLADRMAGGLGFLPRCLICEPPSAIGTRFHANARHDDSALAAFEAKLKRVLAHDMPTAKDGQTLRPRLLPLDPDARTLLVKYSDFIEAAQAPRGHLSHVTGHASKSAEQAARIAGVLTLWRDLNASTVTAQDMRDGIALAQFYLSEAVRLADAAAVSQEIDRAEALRKWLLESWTHPEILTRDVVRRGPNAIRESPKARAALGILEKHGWLQPLDPGTLVRGAARAEAWAIVKGWGDVV